MPLNIATEVFVSHAFNIFSKTGDTANKGVLEGTPHQDRAVSVGWLSSHCLKRGTRLPENNDKHLESRNEDGELTFNAFSINICPLFK